MPVERDDQGRRIVKVEAEVPGTPEEVWRAIATAEGITSWFVPTTSELKPDGTPAKMICHFGPGMDSVAKVTVWNPPHDFTAETQDFGPDGPTVATQWIVETRKGGLCVVRVVHSLFASTDDWDGQLEGVESGWPSFFRILRLYVANFSGQRCTPIALTGFHPGPRDATWRALLDGLGVEGFPLGELVRSSGRAPQLAGTTEHVGDPCYPEEVLLRVQSPAPGVLHMFAMEMAGQVLLSIRFYLYGDAAADVARRQEPVWRDWLAGAFPESGNPSATGLSN